VTRRILEGGAAGFLADRLRGLAVVLHLVHPRADVSGSVIVPRNSAEVKITDVSTPELR
jgi:hypothetical protein